MSKATIQQGAPIVAVGVVSALGALGLGTSALVVKNSVVALVDDATKEKHEESISYGFLSPIHGFAVLYFVFLEIFVVSSLSGISIVVDPPACAVGAGFASIAYVGAKATQYAFFTTRLYYVFRETKFRIKERQLTILKVVILTFAASITINSFIALTTKSQQATIQAGKYNGKDVRVCAAGVQEQFSTTTAINSVIFILCDWYIMIYVVYGFVWRLVQTIEIAPSDRMTAKTVRLAYKSLVLYLFSFISSLIAVAAMLMYPHNLVPNIVPSVDIWLNGMAIYATFTFGEWFNTIFCSCFYPCSRCCLLVCCFHQSDKAKAALSNAAPHLYHLKIKRNEKIHLSMTADSQTRETNKAKSDSE